MIDDLYSAAAPVLLVSNVAAAETRHGRIIAAAGGRLRAVVHIEESVGWLAEQAPVDVVLIEAMGSDAGALLPLLDQSQGAWRHDGTQVVVTTSLTSVDAFAAPALEARINLLVDPQPVDLIAALTVAFAGARTDPVIRDRDAEPTRLRQLSEEVSRIARTLAELSASELAGTNRSGSGRERGVDVTDGSVDQSPDSDADVSPGLIRATIRARRLRDQFFDAQLFADPAWDMLLDLMAARLERRKVAVSSLCIAAAVPATTALRWIKALVDEGLFVRVADPRDGRRVFIELSSSAATGVQAYFAALAAAGLMPG